MDMPIFLNVELYTYIYSFRVSPDIPAKFGITNIHLPGRVIVKVRD